VKGAYSVPDHHRDHSAAESRIIRIAVHVLSCSVHCGASASSSANGQNPANRRDPRVPRSELDGSRGQRLAGDGDSGAPRPPPELVRIEPQGAVTHGIDRGAEAAMAILVHRIATALIGRPGSTTWCGRPTTHVINHGETQGRRLRSMVSGRRQSDPERGIGSDQTLNVEGGVRGESRVFNGRDKVNRGDGRVD
jgi:hypothetical protein